MSSLGCSYVVSVSKEWNRKTNRFDDVSNLCHKLTAENQDFCPKHLLFVEDEAAEIKRRDLARAQRRNLKILAEEELKTSPLAAYNPEFKEKKKANWLSGYDV